MSEPRLYVTRAGAEINVVNGTVEMDDGLFNAVYLSLAGGNDEDPGGADMSRSWWGNALETDPARQLRSRTQYLLATLPATSANLRRIKSAVLEDLSPLVSGGYIKEPDVSLTIPRLGWMQITIASEVASVEILAEWRGPQ